MFHIALVEDEAVDRQRLQSHLDRYREERGESLEVAAFTTGAEFLESFQGQYDLILLDVEMPAVDGMTTAREIRRLDSEVVILFVTNMAQYAIQGYAVDALDYMLKPVSYFAFSQRLDRALGRMKSRARRYVAVPVKGGVRKLDTSSILYVESLDHELTIHTQSGPISTTLTMRQAEQCLSGANFFRGNNSYLINLEHVDAVQDGCAVVKGQPLKLSRPRKNAFLEALADYLGKVVL